MPPDMAISMRHTKLKPEEAALLAGELNKPSWQSTNEGIHERISFEDSIWGFDLAGGSFYKTPLRVTAVKPDSRADKAGIRPGDKVLRINDIDTSTLTIQEAHEIIIESGVHLRIAVTAPEDEEDSYYCYQDPYEEARLLEEERLRQEELARRRQVHAKVSSYWSLQWPWVSKRRVIYTESNCFMVPSKYENKHRDKFPLQPMLRTQDDIVLYNAKSDKVTDKSTVIDTKAVEPIEKPMSNSVAQVEEELNNKILSLAHENENRTGTEVSTSESDFAPVNEIKENGVVETNGINGDVSDLSEMEDSSQDVSSESKIEDLNLPNDVPNNKDDDIINEVIENSTNDISVSEDEVIDSILSNHEQKNDESMEET